MAVLGFVFTGASQAGSGVTLTTVALVLKDVSATQARFFFVLSQGFGAASSVGLAALVFAVSVLALRTRVFPGWLAWIGIIDGILFLVGAYSIASTSDTFGVLGLIAFVIWAIWIIAISVIIFRGGAEPVPVPSSRTAATV